MLCLVLVLIFRASVGVGVGVVVGVGVGIHAAGADCVGSRSCGIEVPVCVGIISGACVGLVLVLVHC